MDNLENFIVNNNIDIRKISELPESHVLDLHEINPIILRYAIYNDPVFSRKSISDIIGIATVPDNYDKSNIVNNLGLYFSKHTEKIVSYSNRSDTMLQYSDQDIVSGLYDSFSKEPMVVLELDNGKALVSENGVHRYHVLKTHYLNELSKANNQEDINNLNKKYTIPLKVETVDLIKTYSNFMLSLTGRPFHLSKERDNSLKQTNNAVLEVRGQQAVLNDQQLIEVIKLNLEKLADRTNIIKTYCEMIPSFNDYIKAYFPELVAERDKHGVGRN